MRNPTFYLLTGLLLLTLLLFSCNENSSKSASTSIVKDNSNAAVAVTMEGMTHTLLLKELNPVKTTFVNDTLQFLFYTNENPFKLNFNLHNTDIIQKGSATYTIPDVNARKVKVDLNFFNSDRNVKRTNKRIIFRKGTIRITKITEHELHMTFEGEGSGMLEYGKNFPISGKVNIRF
jgi:hypothetical protein